MTSKKIPEYLRLLADEPNPAPKDRPPSPAEDLCRLFQQVAGWELALEWRNPKSEAARGAAGPRCDAGTSGPRPAIKVSAFPVSARQTSPPPCDRQLAERFAECLTRLMSEHAAVQTSLLQREAELAAGIPVKQIPDEELHLADRLEAVLRGGAEAIGCQAAGVYLLDEATTELKLRASWGLPSHKLLEPARPLSDAIADLEALLGHAVVLEDTTQLPSWKVPEDYPAAVCVPVSSASTLLGTLWFFSEEPRDFSARETNVAEIIAGRVATELERQVLLYENLQSRQLNRQEESVADRQRAYLPQTPLPLHGWEVSGMTRLAERFGGDFHDWCVMHDGMPVLAVCDADGPGLEAQQTAMLVYAAYKSHLAYGHDCGQLLTRLNETLWTGSAGDQYASFFYGQIDEDRGLLKYSFAGDVVALWIRRNRCEVLRGDEPALGVAAESTYATQTRELSRGDLFIVLSGGVWQHLGGDARSPAVAKLLKRLQKHRGGTAEKVIETILEELGNHHTPHVALDETILVVKRELISEVTFDDNRR